MEEKILADASVALPASCRTNAPLDSDVSLVLPELLTSSCRCLPRAHPALYTGHTTRGRYMEDKRLTPRSSRLDQEVSGFLVLSTRSSKPLATCYHLSCHLHDMAPGLPPVPLMRGSSGSQLTVAARLAGKADLTLHQAGPQTHCLEIRVMMDA